MALTAQNKTDYDAVLAAIATLRAGLSTVDPEAVSVSKLMRSFQAEAEGRTKHNRNKG